MDRHVDRLLQKDIKHIITMQSLLEEYDRQNKYLNQQVLQLLNENSILKIDKAKANIIHNMFKSNCSKATVIGKEVARLSKEDLLAKCSNSIVGNDQNKQHQAKGKPIQNNLRSCSKVKRSNSSKIIQRFRSERDQTIIHTKNVKKDEAVQTSLPQIMHKQQETKKEEAIFSFREQLQQQSDKNTIVKQQQRENSFQLTKGMSNSISKESPQKQLERFIRDEDNIKTIKRDKSTDEGKRPSPQISQTSIRFTYKPTYNRINKSHLKLNTHSFQSLDKRRKFLHVTTAHSPLKPVVKGNGCCC